MCIAWYCRYRERHCVRCIFSIGKCTICVIHSTAGIEKYSLCVMRGIAGMGKGTLCHLCHQEVINSRVPGGPNLA